MNQRIVLLAATMLCMVGCREVVTKPVTVTRTVYVGVPKSLTSPCPVAKPRNDSGKELLRVARDRRAALESCNAKLDAISRIQGTQP